MIHSSPAKALALSGLLLFSCAKAPLTTESTAAAQRGAEVAGAKEVPQASLALQYSTEELARARELFTSGDKDEATSQLLRAEADAELAISLAQAQTEKDSAVAAMERVRQFRAEH